MSIADEITRLQGAKEGIKGAIEAKGVQVPEGSIETYPELIAQIKTQGKYQSKMATPSTEQQDIRPDIGYDALSNVMVDRTPLEETTIIPKPDGVTATPSGKNIGFSKVNVTGDANLLAKNIKAGTTIYGITGTYEGSGGGGDYSSLGVTVSVEAHAGFNAGDRFVGVKNESVKPELLSTTFSTPSGYSIQAMSADMSVVTFSQSIGASSTKYYLGILKENTYEYELVEVSLPNLSGVSGSVNRSKINQDGTLIMIPRNTKC